MTRLGLAGGEAGWGWQGERGEVMAAGLDMAEGQIGEGDEPAILNRVVFAQANIFAGQGRREVQLSPRRRRRESAV